MSATSEVGRQDRNALLGALIGGVQELSEEEQMMMAPQCRSWMQELYPRGREPSAPHELHGSGIATGPGSTAVGRDELKT
eukprot:6394000-Amphidinium_carterae.1